MNGCSSVATSSWQSPATLAPIKSKNTLLIDFNFKLYAFCRADVVVGVVGILLGNLLDVVNANLLGQVNEICKGSIRMP